MNENKTIVNSWNEWDPLKHVIVGRADGTCTVSYTHLTLPTTSTV